MNSAITKQGGGQLHRNVMMGLMGLSFLIMRKSFKVLGSVTIFAAVALAYVWPYIVMEFAGSAHYNARSSKRNTTDFSPL